MRGGVRFAALALALLASPGVALGDGGADIVGGSSTTVEEWPWQVAIASPPDGRDGFDRQFCGGSLVSPTAVVTAAHCVYDSEEAGFLPPEEFSAITGRTVLSSSAGAEIQVSDVIYFVELAGGPAPQSIGSAPVGRSSTTRTRASGTSRSSSCGIPHPPRPRRSRSRRPVSATSGSRATPPMRPVGAIRPASASPFPTTSARWS